MSAGRLLNQRAVIIPVVTSLKEPAKWSSIISQRRQAHAKASRTMDAGTGDSGGPSGSFTFDVRDLKDREKLHQIRDRILRVDHAGEFGADRIYAGQIAVLGRTKSGPVIQHMWDQEKEHLKIFETLIPKYRVRPTILLPIWNVAGFMLGAGTALLGEKAAMACTVAVEACIVEHYNNQIRQLMAQNIDIPQREILESIQKCRDDEQEHHDQGLAHGAEAAPAYQLLTNVIKTGCKGAIWLSERI